MSASEIELRLKEDGRILRKLMVQTSSETMSLSKGIVLSLCRIQQAAAVLHICSLGCTFLDILVRTVVEIVSGEVHIAVKKCERAVQSSHPSGGYAVIAAPAALTATHASSASHIAHYAASHIIETTVVGIVSVQDETELALVGEPSYHRGTLISPVVHIRPGSRYIVSATAHNVSEPPLCHTGTKLKVDYCLFLAIVNTRKHRLVGFFLHDLDLLHHLCRNVLRSELRIVQEECLSVYCDFLDCLSVCRYRAVSSDLHARKFLEKLLKHIVVRGLER